jgi:AraC-like DNA-binding protein
MAIPPVLTSLGADPAEVLAEAGFDPKLFDDPDNLISNAARGRLFAHCVARTGCKHFGLLVGQRTNLYAFGLVGLLAKYAPDAGSALRSLVNGLHLHVRGAATHLEVNGDWAVLSYRIHQPNVEATDQVCDGALAVIVNIMRDLCDPDWKPAEVRFAHRKPEDAGPFRQFFQAPLVFDAEHNAVVFSADWLRFALPDADPEARRLLQKQIDALEARHSDDLPGQVLSLLGTALVTGHGTADQVAAFFSMHSRTLNRRLNAFGTSFQKLRGEACFQIAGQMLELSELEVAQIAAALDYADASAFTRAFRRWSGTTPARWRAQHKAGVLLTEQSRPSAVAKASGPRSRRSATN